LAVAPAGMLLLILTPCAWVGGGCVGTIKAVGVGFAVGVSVGREVGTTMGIELDTPCITVWLGVRLNKAKLRKKRATIEKHSKTLWLTNQLLLYAGCCGCACCSMLLSVL